MDTKRTILNVLPKISNEYFGKYIYVKRGSKKVSYTFSSVMRERKKFTHIFEFW